MYGVSPLSTTELQPQSNTLSSLDTVKTRQQEKYLHIIYYFGIPVFRVQQELFV